MCTGFETAGVIITILIATVLIVVSCAVFLPPLVKHIECRWKEYLDEKFKR